MDFTICPYPYNYIVDGMLGALLYILVSKWGWEQKEECLRRLGIGAISGYIVLITGLPNSFTAMSMGYVGIDMIEALINKVKTKQDKKGEI